GRGGAVTGGRRGTGFGVRFGVQQEGDGSGLINQQDSSMEGNWRGQMGFGGSRSNEERLRCEGEVGSFVWTVKGTKGYSWRGDVLGRVEGGNQRKDCV
ncbi:MAG: hypothetical protein EZS28_044422, partial [Streblomastix strix]